MRARENVHRGRIGPDLGISLLAKVPSFRFPSHRVHHGASMKHSPAISTAPKDILVFGGTSGSAQLAQVDGAWNQSTCTLRNNS